MKRLAAWLGLLILIAPLGAVAALPPKPQNYVADQAGILSPQARQRLNERLLETDRATGDQVVVATFPAVPPEYSMEDFTQRTAEAWGVGRKDRNNGVVLFVFPNERKLRIEVGYGLEGALPDAVANRIINAIIAPAFREGDYDGGVERGVDAILRSIGGGSVRPAASPSDGESSSEGWIFFLLFCLVIIIFLSHLLSRGSSMVYGPQGRRGWQTNRGGWISGGGFGGGGGGGFSGGGGSFGGGGASGGW